MTLGCQFLSPLAEDIERLVLLYWYLPIHHSYLTFDKLDTGLSWDISGISKYHQKMAERKMKKNNFPVTLSLTQKHLECLQPHLVSADVLRLAGEGDSVSHPDGVVGQRPEEVRLGVLGVQECCVGLTT